MRSSHRIAAGAAALALLTACGGGGDAAEDDFADGSAAEILEAAAKDMKAVETLRLAGDITTDGDKVSLDMQVSSQGDCQGSMTMDGGTAEILSVGSKTWLRPDEDFWRASAPSEAEADQAIEAVGDKWVVLDQDADMSSLCDLDEFTGELDAEDASATKAGTETIDGQEAVVIESETEEGDPLTGWVAVDGEHHLLKMEVTEGEEPGTITFSEFDEELDIQAPTDDEVADLSKLG